MKPGICARGEKWNIPSFLSMWNRTFHWLLSTHPVEHRTKFHTHIWHLALSSTGENGQWNVKFYKHRTNRIFHFLPCDECALKAVCFGSAQIHVVYSAGASRKISNIYQRQNGSNRKLAYTQNMKDVYGIVHIFEVFATGTMCTVGLMYWSCLCFSILHSSTEENCGEWVSDFTLLTAIQYPCLSITGNCSVFSLLFHMVYVSFDGKY